MERLTMFRVGFDVRYKGVTEWLPDQRCVMARHGDDAVARARADIMAGWWDDEQDGRKAVRRRPIGARLTGLVLVQTADL